MGTTSSTSTGKYYPDWLGDDTCKNDGSAPEYMILNPTMWLHDTLSDCCKVCLAIYPIECVLCIFPKTSIIIICLFLCVQTNYGWKMNDCMGTTPAGSTGKFYPDWSGANEGCLDDGGEPQYSEY